jgi:uncharacterized protein YkwD
MEALVSAFGDGDRDRYDPYAGGDGGYRAYGGFDGGFDGAEDHAPQHRRGSTRTLMVALIGTLALIVVGAVAFAGSLLVSRTSPPAKPSNVAGAASTDPSGSGDASEAPTENATASAAPTTGAPTTKAATPKPKTTVGGNSSFESQVIGLVNVERRKKANCPDVKNNDKLHAAAYKHSADMANRDYFSHTTPEGVDFATRIKAEKYDWSGAAENIAAGQPTPEAVMRDWMNSSGHRANILNCGLVDLGVGVAYQTKNNRRTPYWTQDFGSPARR